MTICCGRERNSRFCPECGKRLRDPRPIDELLDSVRQTARSKQATYEKRLRDGFSEADLTSEKLLADKWRSWMEALEALINDAEGHAREN